MDMIDKGTFRCKACNGHMHASPPLFEETLCSTCRHKAFLQDDYADYESDLAYTHSIVNYSHDDPMALNNEGECLDYFEGSINVWDKY